MDEETETADVTAEATGTATAHATTGAGMVRESAVAPATKRTLALTARSSPAASHTPTPRRTAATGTKGTRGTVLSGCVTRWR